GRILPAGRCTARLPLVSGTSSPGARCAFSASKLKGRRMNKLVMCMAAILVSSTAFAQVGTTVKEGAKATAETAKEAGDETKAAVSSEPDKTIDKAKAKVHKAKAHHHAHEAKEAAKETTK